MVYKMTHGPHMTDIWRPHFARKLDYRCTAKDFVSDVLFLQPVVNSKQPGNSVKVSPDKAGSTVQTTVSKLEFNVYKTEHSGMQLS